MDAILKKYGQLIRGKRRANNFSLDQLSKLSSVDLSQISRIENEKSSLTLSTAIRIFSALDISLTDLLPKEVVDSMPLFFQKKSKKTDFQKNNLKYLNYNDIDLLDVSGLLGSGKAGGIITFYLEYLAEEADFCIKKTIHTVDLSHLLYNYLAVKDIQNTSENFSPFKAESSLELVDFRYPRELSLENIRNIYKAKGALVLLDIGAYIQRTRYDQNLSLQGLGSAVGFSKQGIRKLENQTPEKIRLEDVLKLDQALNAKGELLDLTWETAKLYAGFYRTKTHISGNLQPFQSFEIHGIEKLVVLSRLFELYWPYTDNWLEGYRYHAERGFAELL